VGRNTVESIQSGVLNGYASLVEGMVMRISREIGGNPKVIATGGFASVMAEVCSGIHVVDANLTLKGLCIAYHRLKS
jgi:type III pantothenate kinase